MLYQLQGVTFEQNSHRNLKVEKLLSPFTGNASLLLSSNLNFPGCQIVQSPGSALFLCVLLNKNLKVEIHFGVFISFAVFVKFFILGRRSASVF